MDEFYQVLELPQQLQGMGASHTDCYPLASCRPEERMSLQAPAEDAELGVRCCDKFLVQIGFI